MNDDFSLRRTPMNHASLMTAEGVAKEIAKATEAHILEQLNDFVSRGLIVIEQMGPTFVQEPTDSRIVVRTAVRLRLKDREYIEKLEKQNAEFRETFAKLSQVIGT